MPALPHGRRQVGGSLVGGAVACALIATVALVATDSDLSATPELRNDLVFRAQRTDPPLAFRQDDPSSWVTMMPSIVNIHRSLRAGELPLWNEHSGGGYSPVRRFQHAVFHPLRLLSVLVPERQAQSFALLLAL
ncbi:MAG TPA: hypothetical protein VGO62_15575, partial [Myxococcota bacterium]